MKTARLLAVLLFSILIWGCAATWPETCPVAEMDDGTRHRACKCEQLIVRKVNDLVTVHCDGVELPLAITGDKIGKLCR